MKTLAVLFAAAVAFVAAGGPAAAEDAELIFRKSTVFKLLSPDHKLATYAIDDPVVSGVACHFTVAETGGWAGYVGLAEDLSDASLACRQVGPISFNDRFEQGEEFFRKQRSIFFKKARIVRGCDARRNVLVYLIYTDKLIEGSPKNSTSTVAIMPWGDTPAAKCGDFVEE